MSKLIIACATLLLGLCTASAQADTLPLPDNLTGFSTHDGEVYFGESDAHEAYFPLAEQFPDPENAGLLRRRQHCHGPERARRPGAGSS